MRRANLSETLGHLSRAGTCMGPKGTGVRKKAGADSVSLAVLLSQQDPEAQTVAWQRFAPMVNAMLTRTFGTGYDTEDLAQDIFLALFRSVHALREPRALKAYLLSITVRTIRYELRRKGSARRALIKHYALVADVWSSAPPSVEAREALVRFCRILNKLKSGDRMAFSLHFFDGLDLTAVSEALGVSMSTTKRRLARAKRWVARHSQRDAALVDYFVEGLGLRSKYATSVGSTANPSGAQPR